MTSPPIPVNIEALPEVVMVELPCYVAGPPSVQQQKASRLLGGEAGLDRALMGGGKLSLRFPSDNALRSCVSAEKVAVSGLLLRLRRRKGAAPGEQYETEVLAKVKSSYAFKSPFDFAFLPSSSGLLEVTCIILYPTRLSSNKLTN